MVEKELVPLENAKANTGRSLCAPGAGADFPCKMTHVPPPLLAPRFEIWGQQGHKVCREGREIGSDEHSWPFQYVWLNDWTPFSLIGVMKLLHHLYASLRSIALSMRTIKSPLCRSIDLFCSASIISHT